MVTSKLADTKVYDVMLVVMVTDVYQAASEVKALDTFYHTLQNEPDRAYYGLVHAVHYLEILYYIYTSLDHVLRANDSNAIDVLMLTDELFR